MGPGVYNNTEMAVTLCKMDNANIEQGGARFWCVVFLYTPTGNHHQRDNRDFSMLSDQWIYYN